MWYPIDGYIVYYGSDEVFNVHIIKVVRESDNKIVYDQNKFRWFNKIKNKKLEEFKDIIFDYLTSRTNLV